MTDKDPIAALGAIMLLMVALSMLGHVASPQPTRHTGTSSIQPASTSIEVYSVYDLLHPLTSVAWGTLMPGDSAYQEVWISNKDASKTYNLTMSMSEWNPPEASSCMNFSWNCTGQILDAQTSICARFNLEVLWNCTGISHFSFMILIGYEEVT
jgi:hypothetical protein